MTDHSADGARRIVPTFLAASFISDVGDAAFWIAGGIWIKELTGSSSAAGLVMFAYVAGGLCSPLAGVMADRVRRKRRLIVAVNLATALVLLPLLPVHDRGSSLIIYPVMFLYGVSGVLLNACQGALIPALVDEERLGTVNSAFETTAQLTKLIAPSIGAGLYAWLGGPAIVLIDVATFLIGATLIATVPVPVPVPAPAPVPTAVLRQMFLASILALLVLGFFETLIFAVVGQEEHHAASYVGVFVTVQGAGGILGAILAGLLLRRLAPGLLCAAGICLIGVACLGLLSPATPVALAATAVIGLCVPLFTVSLITAVQLRTPVDLLGRVIGAFQLGVNLPQTLSIALGAALLPLVGLRPLLLAAAATLVLAGAFLATRGEQREPAPDPSVVHA